MSANAPGAFDGLPDVLRQIAEVAGLPAAMTVAEKFGGTRVYIARRPGPDHWLVKAVGAEDAARIVEHFTTGQTGAAIEIPIGPGGSYNRERRQRAKKLAEATGKGLPEREVALQVGVTGRAVRKFKARQRAQADKAQGDLGF